MLITKFNKMIRNKILWGCFASLICIAFVFSFGQGGCDKSTPKRTNSVAKIYGEDVTPRELMLARYFEMGLRQNVNLPPEALAMLGERALQRIAKLRLATSLGLTATDAELVDVIQRDPSFQQQNVFQQSRYQTVVKQQLGVPVTLFESYLREEITLQKLQELSSSFSWTSPMEIMQGLSDLTDQRTVEYVILPRDTFTPDTEVTPEDAEAYYLANTNEFEIQEKVSVRYVKFDLAPFAEQAEVLETNIVVYYDEHIEDYTTVDTNEESIISPLEDVHDEIATQLRNDIARETAADSATDFVVKLMPGKYGQSGASLEKAAEHAKLAIHTTVLFSVDEEIPGLDVTKEFQSAAFELDASDPALSFSDAVVQSNAVYVLSLQERVDAHVPEFDIVKETAFSLARTNALSEAFVTRVSEVREAIIAKLDEGQSFADATKDFALNVTTTQPFSVYTGFEDETTPYALELPSAIATTDILTLSEPANVEEGVMLALVADRKPAAPGEVDLLRQQFSGSMNRYRASMAFRSFESSILKEAGYEDLTAIDDTPDEDGQ